MQVWMPSDVDHCDGGSPAIAVVGFLDPTSIRRERIVKGIIINNGSPGRRRRFGLRRSVDDGWLFSGSAGNVGVAVATWATQVPNDCRRIRLRNLRLNRPGRWR